MSLRINAFLFCLAVSSVESFAASTVHIAIHRHLHQPIYWGEPDDLRPNQSQFGEDSHRRKSAGMNNYGGTVQNPEVVLVGGENSVFEKSDRIQSYQNWIKGSVEAMNTSDAGMTISYSGALQRNIYSFGRNNSYGYSTSWNANNSTARGWTTSGGSSRADQLGMTYHHALSPLLPKSVLRKEIAMLRERARKSWGMNPDFSDQSKGYWPVEIAFSESLIPVLKEFNYEWTMVGNSHIARTVQNYESKALAAGLLRADPPNRADMTGPTVPDDQWYNANRDTYGNAFPVPFAYQAAWIKYVDPETGVESKMIAVPACDYHGYESGYGTVPWSQIDGKIAQYNDPARPNIVLMANDGDNFWGGGSSFWNEFAPTFMNDAPNHGGKKATTVQQFLDDHPVPTNAIIHVEDGSWLAADQGSPQFYRWLEAPRRLSGVNSQDPKTFYDIENGWNSDMRNWAIMLAGVNYCETAEQIVGPTNVQSWRIEEPYQDNGTYNNPSATERAWHFLLWGFDSGFVYFGTDLDDEVKHTFAANRAISIAGPVVANRTLDTTPPTVFKPQRFPWNPGGKGRGQYINGLTVGYTTPVWSSDFYIWTLAYDISTTTVATLKVRVDADGSNPLTNNENELYTGGAGVSSWVSIPMTRTVIPKNDPTGNPNLNYFLLPTEISDRWWAKVTGYRGKLLDYYIEAQDGRGNLTKTEIQHVYVEDDGTPGGGNPSSVAFSSDPRDCAPLTINYSANGGSLSNITPVQIQISLNGGTNYSMFAMTHVGGGTSTYTLATVPDNTPSAIVWFQGTSGTNTIYDSNGGQNWQTSIRDCDAPTGPGAAFTIPANPSGCDPVTIRYVPNAGVLQTATQLYIHVGRNGWVDVPSPDPAMTKVSNYWNYAYTPTVGTYQIDAVFNDGAGVWDNNSSLDWHFMVSNCVPPSMPAGITITNPPIDISVAEEISAYQLQGTAGSSISGQLSWSNSLSGASGTFSAVPVWNVASLPLSPGTNIITVMGSNAASASVIATDNASNAPYAAWEHGDNGGTGWGGGWIFTTNGSAGHFRGTAAGNTNMNTGAFGWGLYASGGGLAAAVRPLGSVLQVGQSLSLLFDNNGIQNGGVVGIGLQNAGGTNLFEFYFVGGDTNYVVSDSLGGHGTGIPWSNNGWSLGFTKTNATGYRFTVGTNVITGSLSASSDQAIQLIRFFNFDSGPGQNGDTFINNIQITAPATGTISNDTVTIIRSAAQLHDGIPLTWWNQYGLGTNSSATSNNDSDAANNFEEYMADTNPTNAASVYSNRITTASGTAVMSLQAGPPTTNSRVYDIWFCTNLMTGQWTPMNMHVPGAADGSAISMNITNAPDSRSYRTSVGLP